MITTSLKFLLPVFKELEKACVFVESSDKNEYGLAKDRVSGCLQVKYKKQSDEEYGEVEPEIIGLQITTITLTPRVIFDFPLKAIVAVISDSSGESVTITVDDFQAWKVN